MTNGTSDGSGPVARTAARPLDGLVALATGASSGIGRAIALELADAGAAVLLVGRNVANLEACAAAARERTDRVWAVPADLAEQSETHKLFETVVTKANRLDILILCTGIFKRGRIDESGVDQLDELYRANVRAPYLLTQTFLPQLVSHQGQIVFVNSSAGIDARPMTGLFSATQHAFRAMANALRQEVNESGVRVLSVFPGRTATPRMEALFVAEGKPYSPEALMQPRDVAMMIVQALRLPRTAEVTDIHMRPMRKSY